MVMRLALVKDGITKNIIVLSEGAEYKAPEGYSFLPEEAAPKFGTPYAEFLPKATELDKSVQKSTLEKFVELSSDIDYEEIDKEADLLRLVNNPYILGNDKCTITMDWSEKGVYEILMIVNKDNQNGTHGRSVLCSAIKWMFTHTDAILIFGSVHSKTIEAARIAEAVTGTTIHRVRKMHYPIFTIGRWVSGYDIEQTLQEMREGGQTEKADTLAQKWLS